MEATAASMTRALAAVSPIPDEGLPAGSDFAAVISDLLTPATLRCPLSVLCLYGTVAIVVTMAIEFEPTRLVVRGALLDPRGGTNDDSIDLRGFPREDPSGPDQGAHAEEVPRHLGRRRGGGADQAPRGNG